MDIPEDFLHYVWQFRSFDNSGLASTTGEELKIISTGFLNRNAGPDFSNAKIQIGETLWVGQVEIHLKSSDWEKHNHQADKSYDNVILHVVLEHDAEVMREDGSIIPVLILKNRIAQSLIDNYYRLILNLNDFPCKAQIKNVDTLIVDSFLSRVVIERFEQKTKQVFECLSQLKGNWDDAFYHFLARNFGFKVNALPFELLAKSIPQHYFAKHKNNPEQIEALIFGVAGFLNDKFQDTYPAKLKCEFDYLKKKYLIKPIDVDLWKFMRMRPQNFPTLRLAQFSALIVQSNHLFSKIMEIKDVGELKKIFEKLPVNEYWKHHYHFRKKAEGVKIQLGKNSIDNILLNTVALFLFAYGKYTSTQFYVSRAIKLLESLPPEKNAITERFVTAGVRTDHAFASQGVLQLKKQYCDEKKCLSCGIGIKILKLA